MKIALAIMFYIGIGFAVTLATIMLDVKMETFDKDDEDNVCYIFFFLFWPIFVPIVIIVLMGGLLLRLFNEVGETMNRDRKDGKL